MSKELLRTRIGNTVTVVLPVLTRGDAVSLVGRDITIMLVDPNDTKTPVSFTIGGVDNNIATFVVEGTSQSATGTYRAEVYENYRGTAMAVYDCDIFVLVARTEYENDGNEGVSSETTTLDPINIAWVGRDGYTPYIQDGYWYINGTSTNVKAAGENGDTPYIENGYWYIGGVSTGIKVDYTNEEAQRAAAEQVRVVAEAARVQAEAARTLAENSRLTEESGRSAAEGVRILAERDRQAAETTRQTQEEIRHDNEEARVEAELGRAASEASRAQVEATRVANESARTTAEATRAANEQTRVSDETDRAAAETARIAAETARETAEGGRTSAEATRVSNEQTRVSNESTRQSNESARQAAETARQSAYTAAENARDAAFAEKEATRDAANEAALNCADALAALGPKIDEVNTILETGQMSVDSILTYNDTYVHNGVSGYSWYVNSSNNQLMFYDYSGNNCPEVLTVKVYPVTKGIEYTISIAKTTNYYGSGKRCVGFSTSSSTMSNIAATDGTNHNGGTRTITYTPSEDGFIFVTYASKSKDGQTTYDEPTVKYVCTTNAIERLDQGLASANDEIDGIDGKINNVNVLLQSTDFSDDASVSVEGNGTSVQLSDVTLYTVQSNNAKITISIPELSWDSSYKWTLLRIKVLRGGNTVIQKEWVNPGREGSLPGIEYIVISSSISFTITCQKGDEIVIANRLSANFTVNVNEDATYYKRIDDIEDRLNTLAPNYTYEYYGERIVLPKNKFNYSIVGRNIINGKASVDGGALASQGMCIYGDYMFNFFNCGYVQIHDFNDNYAIKGEYKMDIYSTSGGTHANLVSFGKENGSIFPYAYLMDGSWSNVLVEDLTLSDSTLTQTISFDWHPTNTQLQAVVGDDGYLYVMALLTSSSTDKEIKIRRYRLPLVSEGNVTLTDVDCEGEWGIYFDYTNGVEGTNGVIQGGKIYNGRFYLARGSGMDNCQKVEVYDTGSFSLLATIPLHGVINEPEDLDFHDGKMYIVGYNQYMAWELSF